MSYMYVSLNLGYACNQHAPIRRSHRHGETGGETDGETYTGMLLSGLPGSHLHSNIVFFDITTLSEISDPYAFNPDYSPYT